MNEFYESNKRSLLMLAGLLLLLAIVLYFILLRPLISDLKQEESQIVATKDEIENIKEEIEEYKQLTEEVDLEEVVLENKIPRERQLDEYILSLQQLELYSKSKIDTIQFTYDSSLDLPEPIEETSESEEDTILEDEDDIREEEELTETEEDPDSEEDGEEFEQITIDPEILEEKPEELQVMTVRIVVTSPDFDEFLNLLEVIENNDRISIVTSLNFLKPTEEDIYFDEDATEHIFFTAELTTFYYAD